MIVEPLDFVNGLFSLIIVIVGIIVGIKIASKYPKYKTKPLIYIGIAVFGCYNTWWGNALAFLYYVFLDKEIDIVLYLTVSYVFLPLFICMWVLGVSEMRFENNRTLIVIIYLVITIIIDVIIMYYIINDPYVLARFKGPFSRQDSLFLAIYTLFMASTVLITGLLLALELLKSKIPENNLKGKFLSAALICFFIGVFIENDLIPISIVMLIIGRSILILSSIFLYFSFSLPDFIKKRFITQNKKKS